MNFLRLGLLTLALSLFGGQALAKDTLRIATEGAYPPFNYIDESGQIAGFDVDIAHALCQVMDMQCTIVINEWDTLLDGLAEDKYDAVIASMAHTPERGKFADFTDYYYRSRSTFVADPTKDFAQTREGVKGLTLGGQDNTVQANYLLANFAGSATIKLAPTMKEAFAMLANGEVDAVLSDSLTIYDFLQTTAGKRFDFVGKPLPATDPSSQACIAVGKGKTKLVQDLNTAIRTIRINGTYNKINRKYFPFSIY